MRRSAGWLLLVLLAVVALSVFTAWKESAGNGTGGGTDGESGEATGKIVRDHLDRWTPLAP